MDNPPEAAQVASIATPLNLVLLTLTLLLLYSRFRPRHPPTLLAAPLPTLFCTFTPRTLLPYNGEHSSPVYLAVNSKVFDVSSGANFYGPGGPYSNFAGRDASRGLALGSFDEDVLTKDLDGPIDDLSGLGEEEMGALRGWEERFGEKYLVVGRLVAVGDVEADEKEKQ